MATIDEIINGSFNAIGAPPSYISPAYNPADYASIYSKPTPTYQSGMMGRGMPPSVGSPNLTVAEQQLLQRQIEQSKALQAGYNPDGTRRPVAPSVGVPVNPPQWGSFEQANYDARHKPGTWMAQSRMQAQALMRQMALRNGTPAMPQSMPAKAPAGGIASLLTGYGTPRAGGNGGGLAAMAAQPQGATGTSTNGYVYSNGQNMGQAPQYQGLTPSQMYDLINARAGNRSSSGGVTRGSLLSNAGLGDGEAA